VQKPFIGEAAVFPMNKISTGAAFFDAFLQGGYDSDVVTTIYGPSGSGKTNLCLLAAVRCVHDGKKVLFVDTEGGIAVERIRQIDPAVDLQKMLFFTPLTFTEQKAVLQQLPSLVTEHLGLIIVDSISMLYRLELGQSEDVYDVNSALGKQLGILVEIARRSKIPVLLTTQVYSAFDDRETIKMVGGDLLKYGSKCLLELQRFASCRKIVLRKHRSLPEGGEVAFRIVEKGIEEKKS